MQKAAEEEESILWLINDVSCLLNYFHLYFAGNGLFKWCLYGKCDVWQYCVNWNPIVAHCHGACEGLHQPILYVDKEVICDLIPLPFIPHSRRSLSQLIRIGSYWRKVSLSLRTSLNSYCYLFPIIQFYFFSSLLARRQWKFSPPHSKIVLRHLKNYSL
jgi:hypothetical protein